MKIKTEVYQPNNKLVLWDTSQFYSTLSVTLLSLTWQGERLFECQLTFQSDLELHQQINIKVLFNLKPELRGTLTGEFLPDRPIEIEATLQPDLLVHLQDYPTSEAAADYLQTLSQTQPDHPLLNTESWYALHVKQQQETGEVGYRTFWSYINPAILAQENLSSEAITAGMISFFKDRMQANPEEINQVSLEETLDEILQSFDQWVDTSLVEGESIISEAIDEATTAIDDLIESLSEAAEEIQPSLYQAIIHFFSEDDWSFTKLQGEPILRMAFKGQNGEWTCYAKAKEDQQQFIFYSICPIAAPEDKRSAIAEFLTRANYGMTIGNFELDFSDGEIRYKTSIDVEGDDLTHALIKRLVYTNVMMMDEYLPGIKAVIEAGISPEEAIRAIEQPDPSHQPDQELSG